MARKHLKVLVAGGFDPEDQGALDKSTDDFAAFGRLLGKTIIEHGHSLINGCQTELDEIVAESAHNHLKQVKLHKTQFSSV